MNRKAKTNTGKKIFEKKYFFKKFKSTLTNILNLWSKSWYWSDPIKSKPKKAKKQDS